MLHVFDVLEVIFIVILISVFLFQCCFFFSQIFSSVEYCKSFCFCLFFMTPFSDRWFVRGDWNSWCMMFYNICKLWCMMFYNICKLWCMMFYNICKLWCMMFYNICKLWCMMFYNICKLYMYKCFTRVEWTSHQILAKNLAYYYSEFTVANLAAQTSLQFGQFYALNRFVSTKLLWASIFCNLASLQ